MVEAGTWERIKAEGLLSTTTPVQVLDPPEDLFRLVLGENRMNSVRLDDGDSGTVWTRDQKPLARLKSALTPDTTVQQYLDMLNGRVFFWLRKERLQTFLDHLPIRRAHRPDR